MLKRLMPNTHLPMNIQMFAEKDDNSAKEQETEQVKTK